MQNQTQQTSPSESSEAIVCRIADLPEVKVLLELEKLVCLETYEHSVSVAITTAKMLTAIRQWDVHEKEEIVKGALLHDIGKVFPPFNLTQIPRTLTGEEYDIIKTHTALSYEITKPVFSKIVQNICLYHHERPNGTGYLSKANLANIPEEALIVQVADIYDALTRERAYKHKYAPEFAIKEMYQEAKGLFLDDGFLSVLEKSVLEDNNNNQE